jgi:hypothetical protein
MDFRNVTSSSSVPDWSEPVSTGQAASSTPVESEPAEGLEEQSISDSSAEKTKKQEKVLKKAKAEAGVLGAKLIKMNRKSPPDQLVVRIVNRIKDLDITDAESLQQLAKDLSVASKYAMWITTIVAKLQKIGVSAEVLKGFLQAEPTDLGALSAEQSELLKVGLKQIGRVMGIVLHSGRILDTAKKAHETSAITNAAVVKFTSSAAKMGKFVTGLLQESGFVSEASGELAGSVASMIGSAATLISKKSTALDRTTATIDLADTAIQTVGYSVPVLSNISHLLGLLSIIRPEPAKVHPRPLDCVGSKADFEALKASAKAAVRDLGEYYWDQEGASRDLELSLGIMSEAERAETRFMNFEEVLEKIDAATNEYELLELLTGYYDAAVRFVPSLLESISAFDEVHYKLQNTLEDAQRTATSPQAELELLRFQAIASVQELGVKITPRRDGQLSASVLLLSIARSIQDAKTTEELAIALRQCAQRIESLGGGRISRTNAAQLSKSIRELGWKAQLAAEARRAGFAIPAEKLSPKQNDFNRLKIAYLRTKLVLAEQAAAEAGSTERSYRLLSPEDRERMLGVELSLQIELAGIEDGCDPATFIRYLIRLNDFYGQYQVVMPAQAVKERQALLRESVNLLGLEGVVSPTALNPAKSRAIRFLNDVHKQYSQQLQWQAEQGGGGFAGGIVSFPEPRGYLQLRDKLDTMIQELSQADVDPARLRDILQQYRRDFFEPLLELESITSSGQVEKDLLEDWKKIEAQAEWYVRLHELPAVHTPAEGRDYLINRTRILLESLVSNEQVISRLIMLERTDSRRGDEIITSLVAMYRVLNTVPDINGPAGVMASLQKLVDVLTSEAVISQDEAKLFLDLLQESQAVSTG